MQSLYCEFYSWPDRQALIHTSLRRLSHTFIHILYTNRYSALNERGTLNPGICSVDDDEWGPPTWSSHAQHTTSGRGLADNPVLYLILSVAHPHTPNQPSMNKISQHPFNSLFIPVIIRLWARIFRNLYVDHIVCRPDAVFIVSMLDDNAPIDAIPE